VACQNRALQVSDFANKGKSAVLPLHTETQQEVVSEYPQCRVNLDASTGQVACQAGSPDCEAATKELLEHVCACPEFVLSMP
jgi:hypothetical protein